ncbi:cell death regulator Aven [Nematostella vectensis]|uniref:cell death regulator Aven n=1 Tax=Nematostella vectensis TaxID=45351 RepID=UPI002076DC80|nr:cell death regulator Aven [Nematostella vectensis]
MRPDEHKRKKNAQYKKKHGIPVKKGAGKPDKPTDSADVKPGEKENQETCSQTTPLDESRWFSRRHLTTNWDRYEGLDIADEEDQRTLVTSRGEDFANLVEKAGNPDSQFRFQAEKEWEEDTMSQAASEGLEINLASLAEALQGLPIYRKLHIDDKEINPSSSLRCLDQVEKAVDGTGNSYYTASTLTLTAEKQASSCTVETLKHHYIEKPSSTTKDDRHDNRQLSVTEAPPTTHLHSSLRDVASGVYSYQSHNTSKDQTGSVIDSELDFLLSLDNTKLNAVSSKKPVNGNKVSPFSNQVYSSADDKELQSTGAGAFMHAPKEQPLLNTSVDSEKGETKRQSETEQDLEDWLDSVLS